MRLEADTGTALQRSARIKFSPLACRWVKKKRLFFQSVRDPPNLYSIFVVPKTLNDTVVFGPSSSKLCREPDLHISRRTEHQNG